MLEDVYEHVHAEIRDVSLKKWIRPYQQSLAPTRFNEEPLISVPETSPRQILECCAPACSRLTGFFLRPIHM
jgi:hypothetical protein